MRYRTFSEYVQMREGLLLPDRPVTPGGLRINPFPATQARLKQMKPKPVKPATTPPTKPKPPNEAGHAATAPTVQAAKTFIAHPAGF